LASGTGRFHDLLAYHDLPSYRDAAKRSTFHVTDPREIRRPSQFQDLCAHVEKRTQPADAVGQLSVRQDSSKTPPTFVALAEPSHPCQTQ
jgi:hypothetical protein